MTPTPGGSRRLWPTSPARHGPRSRMCEACCHRIRRAGCLCVSTVCWTALSTEAGARWRSSMSDRLARSRPSWRKSPTAFSRRCSPTRSSTATEDGRSTSLWRGHREGDRARCCASRWSTESRPTATRVTPPAAGSMVCAGASGPWVHVGAILRKLDLRDRVQIVVFAHQHRLG